MTDLEQLLARDEMRQLAERYGVYIDARDLERLVQLYVPDVRVTHTSSGREALLEDFRTWMRQVGVTFLCVGNHLIDFEDDENAVGIVYCRAEIQDGGKDSKRFIHQAIQYHDRYRKHEGRWLFVRRKHLLVWGAAFGENPLVLEPAEWPRSQTGMGSVPGDLETWQRFWED